MDYVWLFPFVSFVAGLWIGYLLAASDRKDYRGHVPPRPIPMPNYERADAEDRLPSRVKMKVFNAFPSNAAAARAFKVSGETIRKWKKNGVPAERVIEVAEKSGWKMTPHAIRSDIYPNPTDAVPADVAANMSLPDLSRYGIEVNGSVLIDEATERQHRKLLDSTANLQEVA